MKVISLILLMVALVASGDDHSEATKECGEKTGVALSDVQEYLLKDDSDTDAKATKFMICIFEKQGVIDDGKFDAEKAKETVNNYMKLVDAGDDQEALDCIQEKDKLEETVLEVAKCVEKRKEELTKSK